MTKLCAIVDAYSTGRFLPQELKKYGFSAIHVQSGPEIPVFYRSHFNSADFVEHFTCQGNEADIADALAARGVAFVMAGSEVGINVADALSERLGLPSNGTFSSHLRRNKYAMSEALQAQGVRGILNVLSDDSGEILAWQDRNGLDEIVVKPVNSAGTEDVYFCRDPDQVALAVSSIVGKTNLLGLVNESALAQECIRGRQYTVNAVCMDEAVYVGEVWTYETKEVAGAGSVCSLEIFLDGSGVEASELSAYLPDALRALQVAQGPVHAEIIVDDTGPVVVDLGARLQGSMSREATIRAVGHDHVGLTAMRYADPDAYRAYVLGNTPYQRRKLCYCVSLISEEEGVVTGHPGLDRIRALPTFADAIAFAPEGSRVKPTRDLASTPGIIYLVADGEEDLRRDYARIRSLSMKDIFGLVDASIQPP